MAKPDLVEEDENDQQTLQDKNLIETHNSVNKTSKTVSKHTKNKQNQQVISSNPLLAQDDFDTSDEEVNNNKNLLIKIT